MKSLLFLALIFSLSPIKADDYLKLKSYPEYPLPNKGVGRFVDLVIKPNTQQDLQFDLIFDEVSKVSLIAEHDLAVMHEAGINLEISHNGKIITTQYSKSKVVKNSKLKKHWTKILQLIQDITREQY